MTRNDDFEARLSNELTTYARDAYEPRDYSTAARDAMGAATQRPWWVAWLAVAAVVALGVTTAVAAIGLWLPRSPQPAGQTAIQREVDRLFSSTRTCQTVIGGSSVTFDYPSEWWAFPGEDGAPACVWLAPNDTGLDGPITERPAGVVITIGAVGGGPEVAGDPLTSKSVTVAGRSAIRNEEIRPSDSGPTKMLLYWVPLGSAGDGPTMVIETEEVKGSDYELNATILDRLVAGLQVR